MVKTYWVDETFDRSFFSETSCAFGVFDGLHRGHRFLLDCARQTACEQESRSIALTFDIDPDELFHADRLKKLMSNDERLAALAASGVDAVCVLPFTCSFAASSPEEFLFKTFEEYIPAFLHVGCDFKFGARAAGTVDDLDTWSTRVGSCIRAHDLMSADGAPITATRIRLLLQDGKIEEAQRLLGHTYCLSGIVQEGRGEGAGMGFRTANFNVENQLRPIGDGVYAAWAKVGAKRYKAAVNVGGAASFADRATATCEAHLLDFEGNLYGKPIKIEFIHRLRPVYKFDDIDELIATVKSNIEWVRNNL